RPPDRRDRAAARDPARHGPVPPPLRPQAAACGDRRRRRQGDGPMNDDALERELRAWYRAEIDDSVVAPADLRDDVRASPALRLPVRRSGVGRRPTMLLIAAAVRSEERRVGEGGRWGGCPAQG